MSTNEEKHDPYSPNGKCELAVEILDTRLIYNAVADGEADYFTSGVEV